MNVLFVSRVNTVDNLNDSLTIVPRRMFQHMLAKDPDLTITWTCPKMGEDEQAKLEKEYDPGGRIKFLPINGTYSTRIEGYMVDIELVNALRQYDLVVCQKPAVYRMLRDLCPVPCLMWHLWTATQAHAKQIPMTYLGDPDVMAEQFSMLEGFHVYESHYLRGESLRNVGKYLSSKALDNWNLRSCVIPNGILVDKIDSLRKPVTPTRLIWGGRWTPPKGFPAVVSSFSAAYRQKLTDEIVLTSPYSIEKSPLSAADVRVVDQNGWLEALAGGGFSVCSSKAESYGISWLEMLYSGVNVIFVRAPWQEGLLPPDYPFIVEKESQLASTLIGLLQRPDFAVDYNEEVIKPWIRQRHDQRINALALLDVLRKVYMGMYRA